MTTSGIITRGYGFTRSTIITRGYGRISIVEEIIDLIPGVRRRPGGSKFRKRSPPYDWEPPDQKPVEQFEEVCVTVELLDAHGAELVDPIRGEMCRRFEQVGVYVDVTGVTVRPMGKGTVVEVTMIQATPVGRATFHVSASVANT